MAAQVLDDQSLLSGKSELELFTVPPTQIAIDSGYWHEVHPKNTLTTSGPYEFHITSDPHWMDLSRNYIHMKLKITKSDGTDIPEPTLVNNVSKYPCAPINLLGKTFFKQIKLWLNNKLCYDSGDLYAYRAYLETMLNYGREAKNTHLQAGLYYIDESGKMDDKNNFGFRQRGAWCKTSRVLELMAPIHTDLFNQDRLMVNHMDLKLELHRNSDDFCLLTYDPARKCKIKVESMAWYVRKVDILKTLAIGLETHLTKTPAKYPLRRVVLKTIHVAGGRRELADTLIFSGQIPRRVLITCVDANAYHGSQQLNPFNFKHQNIRQVQITAGGVTYPRNPSDLDFENDRYTRAYISLYETLNTLNDDKSNGINYSDFGKGYTIFALDLSPSGTDGNHWELIREGSTYMKINFATDTPDTGIKILAFAEYDNLLMIDKFRNVFYDYTI